MRRITALSFACGLLLSSCAKDASPAPGEKSATVRISVTARGPQSQLGRDLLAAAQIELDRLGNKAGPVALSLKTFDEPVDPLGAGDSRASSEAAGVAAGDSSTVAWLGNWDSNSTAVVLPRLNQAGVIAVSPGATATPFTSRDLQFPGAPVKYFPDEARFGRTFLRVVPDDRRIASAALGVLAQSGMKTIYTADGGDTDGISWSSAFESGASRFGIRIVGHMTLGDRDADAPRAIAQAAQLGADAIVWGSPVGKGAQEVWNAARSTSLSMIGGPALYGPQASRLAEVPQGTWIFSPVIPPASLGTHAEQEQKLFSQMAGRELMPGALNAAACLQVIAAAVSMGAKTDGPTPTGGSLRSLTTDSLHRLGAVETVLGPIKFDSQGNPKDRPVGQWRLTGGRLEFTAKR